MFEFVRGQAGPVTRDEVAGATGVSVKLAAFHLDKLVAADLLRASQLPTGRVGRRPKAYEPSDTEFEVVVPERRYELAAEMFTDALGRLGSPEAAVAVNETAAARGRARGEAARAGVRGRLGPERALTAVADVLAHGGYEPLRAERGRLVMRNCPFHHLARRNTELVCGLNHAYVAGMVEGLQADPVLEARLVPQPGYCCVEVRGRET